MNIQGKESIIGWDKVGGEIDCPELVQFVKIRELSIRRQQEAEEEQRGADLRLTIETENLLSNWQLLILFSELDGEFMISTSGHHPHLLGLDIQENESPMYSSCKWDIGSVESNRAIQFYCKSIEILEIRRL